MYNKGLLLVAALGLLSACDSSDKPASQTPAAPELTTPSKVDRAELAKHYAGRALTVASVAEVQDQGASTLAVSFSIPLDPEQRFSDFLHLTTADGKPVDGAWVLNDNLNELRLRHLPPASKLALTVDGGLRAVNGSALGKGHEAKLETGDLAASIGFASRGSLLPLRLAEGLPVIALNVDQVNVEFFRIRQEQLASFLGQWDNGSSLSNWEAEELLPLAELVYGGRFELKPEANTREQLVLPMTGIKALQQPGVYLAVMREAGTYTYRQPATLFSLSDIGLSLHRFHDQLEVFAQALDGGSLLKGVELQLLDAEGDLLASGVTDGKGHASLPASARARLLMATQDGQTSLLELNQPALDLGEFDITGPSDEAQQLFVFGPRDLYRPGETVLLNALLRDRDGKALPAQPLKAQVRQPDGKVMREFVWTAGEDGLYQYRLAVDASLPTGRWQLELETGAGSQQLYDFRIEDFLPERMALELAASDQPLAVDAPVRFDISGRYLYGAPASGNLLTSELYLKPLREAVPALPGFLFGDITEDNLKRQFWPDDLKLDAEGRAVLKQENRWSSARSPVVLSLSASLQESAGRPVTRRIEQPVWPAARLPGLRGVFDGDRVDNNSLVEFELLLADAEGHKLAGDDLTVRLVQERRDYYWSFDEGWDYRYNVTELVLDEQQISTPADGVARVSFPVDWGSYRVELVDNATGLRSNQRFWAGYRWQDNDDSSAAQRPDQVKLELDKAAYADGDTAKVTVTPPAAGSGYLLVESSDGPLWWQAIEVPAEGKTFRIPLDKEWQRHDLYVSALVVRPGERKARQTPRRAVGLLHIPLEREQRRLTLELQAVEKMRPNQPLKVKVRARHADGSVASDARVLLSAVDVGILNITRFETPDPFDAFFGRKRYGADQLDVYGKLIEAGDGRLAKLAFGGDAELDEGGQLPPSDVLIVAEQAEPLALDANGEGEVVLNIPDFNGELRLMAQGWTSEQFGKAEGKTVVAAPLVAEISMPRFLAGGDESVLALDLSNQSGAAQNVQVQLAAAGQLALTAATEYSLNLAEGQRRTLQLPVRALGGYGEGRLSLRVNGLQLPGEEVQALERNWMLGVRPAWPAQVEHLRSVLKDDQPWQFPADVLDRFASEGLQARLSLSARPPLDIGQQIQQLRAYPYGCLEQTTSGLYPSLYADAATLGRLGIEGEEEQVRREKIERGISRLLGMQQHRGGFGLWNADSPEEYWLTVYVTDFLLRAREQGFSVPDQALEKATARLLNYLQQGNQISKGHSDSWEHTRFAVQAYAGYVLARSQQAPLGNLRSLYQRRQQARSGLPLLQLAAALRLMGDAPRAEQALKAGMALRREGRQWYGDYGSELRDLALGYALLEEQDMAASQRPQLLWSLSEALSSREWLSTQERNALFLAGRHLLSSSEQPWSASLQAGAQQKTLDGEHPVLNLAPALLAAQPQVSGSASAEQPLYMQLSLSGYPASAPAAQSNNLSIWREFLGSDGKALDISQLRSGDLVLVHLIVEAEQAVTDALVVDMLPAGLELENQNLADSSASLDEVAGEAGNYLKAMRETRWDDESWLRHQEFRSDRYVAAIEVRPWHTTHLLYLARAVTPGRYQVPPPQVESMYRPDWRARGAVPAQLLEVRAR